MSEKKKERIEKGREEKTEAAKEKSHKKRTDEVTKKAFVEADSASGLIEKIRQIDWGILKSQRQKHREAALITAFRKIGRNDYGNGNQ